MSYKVFVRHVPKNASKEYIQEAFEKEFGEVEDIAIPTDPYTFKPRGFIYVTFTRQESMEAALRKGTCSVMGSTVEINTVETKKKGKQCQRLYIKGLPTDSNEKDLLAYFKSKGNVVLSIFPRDRNNGLLRNFCYITFDSESLTNQLLQDGYMMMDDVRLTVTAAQRRDQLYPDSYERPKATDKIDELVNPNQQEYDPSMYSGPSATNYNYQYPPQDPYGYNYGQYDPNYQYPPSQQGQYYDPNYQYPPENGGYGQYDSNYQYPSQDGYGQYDPNYQYPPYPESSNSAYTTPSEISKHPGADNEKSTESTVPPTESTKPSDPYAYPSGDVPSSDPYRQPSHDPYSYNPQEAYQQPTSTDPYNQPPAGNPYQQPPSTDPYKQPPPVGSPYQQPPPVGSPYQQPPSTDPYKQPPPAGGNPPYQQPPSTDPYKQPPPASSPYQQPPSADPYKQPPPVGSPYQQPPAGNPPYQQPPYNPYQQPPMYPPQGEWDRRDPRGWDRGEPPREREHRRPSGWDRRDPQSGWDRRDPQSGWDRQESRGWDRRDPQSGWDNRQRERSRSRNRDSGSYRHDQGEDLTRIFIQGLIPTITEQDLKDHFSPYGRVVHVSLPINHETGKQRDLAFVTMDSPESVDRVLREASRTIKGCPVKQICRAKSKPSRR